MIGRNSNNLFICSVIHNERDNILNKKTDTENILYANILHIDRNYHDLNRLNSFEDEILSLFSYEIFLLFI